MQSANCIQASRTDLEENVRKAMRSCFGDEANESLLGFISIIIMQSIDALNSNSKAFVREYCNPFGSPYKKTLKFMCFTSIVYVLKLCSPTYERIKLRSIEELRAKYPTITNKIYSSEELQLFLEYVNSLRMALSIIPAKNNKRLLMDIASRLEGLSPMTYITGSGQTPATRRRVEVYEQEGGELPIPKIKRQKLRENVDNLSDPFDFFTPEVFTTHENIAEEGPYNTIDQQNASIDDDSLSNSITTQNNAIEDEIAFQSFLAGFNDEEDIQQFLQESHTTKRSIQESPVIDIPQNKKPRGIVLEPTVPVDDSYLINSVPFIPFDILQRTSYEQSVTSPAIMLIQSSPKDLDDFSVDLEFLITDDFMDSR
eukprot:CAMPEP_0201112130 /NCGR_PEP_ID=MMETSP0812-20130820/77052_1 /ASSEMBLY_ACC=CAM_ASM_000668 /TAXON_ID=98059 /ORGANISM="Dinobryon sp., Strain UTEXLB2267" /LENGTH=369 /DNA_ID=CAMNT_0047375389 /DNA_START=489 /DNA_END=1598 /DNA_ORIENTATION=-